MQPLIPFVMLGVVAFAMVVAAELARSLVARIAKLPLGRTRWKLADLPGVSPSGRVGARLAATLVGPVAGYLFLVCLAFGAARCAGVPSIEPAARIAEVTDGYPAAGQLAPGDRITEIHGEPFPGGAEALSRAVNAAGGAPIALTVERDGERRVVRVEPARRSERDPWRLGVKLTSDRVYDTALSARVGFEYPIRQVRSIIGGLVESLVGSEQADPGGPVRIVAEYREPAVSSASVAWLAPVVGVYLWLVLCAFDLVRAIILLVRR